MFKKLAYEEGNKAAMGEMMKEKAKEMGIDLKERYDGASDCEPT